MNRVVEGSMRGISRQARYRLAVFFAAALAGRFMGVADLRAAPSHAVARVAPTDEARQDVPQPDRVGARVSEADVLTMLQEGFSESLIIDAIEVSGIRFEVTVAVMVELKKAGASDRLLQVLLAQRQPRRSDPDPNTVRMENMALIPAGEFTMGVANGEEDTSPPHPVYLDAFYIDRHEVTNVEYEQFDPEHRKSRAFDCDNCPVTNVSWSDAAAFAEWAGKRLPTEAEWEKAARGPEGNLYGYKNEYQEGLAHVKTGAATAVQTYPPNGYGLFDALGNVWEWVADYYAPDYYRNSPAERPTGPLDGPGRVVRGGSYNDGEQIHLAVRTWKNPRYRFPSIGFRCAMDATDPLPK